MKQGLLTVLLLAYVCVANAEPIKTQPLVSLELAVSNNAVALLEAPKGLYLYSFLGLGEAKTWQNISSAAWVLKPGETTWTGLDPVPGGAGRLASSAVSLAGAVWLFGGYTVDADGGEKSIPGVYRIRPGENGLQWVTDMPIPVDDSVVLTYKDRYIYMVSGWHDLGNVNLVQVFDTKTMTWEQATPWPGSPVFGHAGGISGGRMLICDGVKIQYPSAVSAREFVPSNECWLGSIDADNHRRLSWRRLEAHPGKALYRMASTGNNSNQVVFAGGSANPYNFNGVGYNGVPSEPETTVFSYDLMTDEWKTRGDLPIGTMDHRGLLFSDDWYYLVGGMHAGQKPVADVYRFKLEK